MCLDHVVPDLLALTLQSQGTKSAGFVHRSFPACSDDVVYYQRWVDLLAGAVDDTVHGFNQQRESPDRYCYTIPASALVPHMGYKRRATEGAITSGLDWIVRTHSHLAIA